MASYRGRPLWQPCSAAPYDQNFLQTFSLCVPSQTLHGAFRRTNITVKLIGQTDAFKFFLNSLGGSQAAWMVNGLVDHDTAKIHGFGLAGYFKAAFGFYDVDEDLPWNSEKVLLITPVEFRDKNNMANFKFCLIFIE